MMGTLLILGKEIERSENEQLKVYLHSTLFAVLTFHFMSHMSKTIQTRP